MQRKIFSNIALLFLVNLIVKPFWILGIDRNVQNLVGYSEYGVYVNMFSLSVILTMLLDFGINNFNSSSIANDPSRLETQFSSLVSLKLILSAIYLILTTLLAYLYGCSLHEIGLISLLGLCQVLAHFSTFVRSSISGLQLFRTDALLSSVDRFAMILLGLCMILGLFQTSITHFIYIQLAGYTVALISGSLILGKYMSGFRIRFNRELMMGLLRKTWPYALLALIMLMYSRIDVLLIRKMIQNGDLENGVYASGGRLLEASNMMVGALAAILLPFFARMIATKQDLSPVSKTIAALILIPVMLFSTGCHIYGLQIMQLLSPGSSEYTANVFSLLILCFIPYSLMLIFGSMLTAKAEMKILNLVCFFALLVNLGMNFVLIPLYGALGAAVAALCTHSVVGLGKMYFAIRKVGLNHPALHYFKLSGFFLLALAGFKILHYFEFGILPAFVLMSIVMMAWILVLKMLNIYSLISVVNQFIRDIRK